MRRKRWLASCVVLEVGPSPSAPISESPRRSLQ